LKIIFGNYLIDFVKIMFKGRNTTGMKSGVMIERERERKEVFFVVVSVLLLTGVCASPNATTKIKKVSEEI